MKNEYREKAITRQWYDLQPQYSNVKSFYGKAEVEMLDMGYMRIYNLFSYKVNVARIVVINNTINAFNFKRYSSTTSRHQKEFFKQFGYDDEEIRLMMNRELSDSEIEKLNAKY